MDFEYLGYKFIRVYNNETCNWNISISEKKTQRIIDKINDLKNWFENEVKKCNGNVKEINRIIYKFHFFYCHIMYNKLYIDDYKFYIFGYPNNYKLLINNFGIKLKIPTNLEGKLHELKNKVIASKKTTNISCPKLFFPSTDFEFDKLIEMRKSLYLISGEQGKVRGKHNVTSKIITKKTLKFRLKFYYDVEYNDDIYNENNTFYKVYKILDAKIAEEIKKEE